MRLRLLLATSGCSGGPGRSRTADLRFRKPSLYPSELRGHAQGNLKSITQLSGSDVASATEFCPIPRPLRLERRFFGAPPSRVPASWFRAQQTGSLAKKRNLARLGRLARVVLSRFDHTRGTYIPRPSRRRSGLLDEEILDAEPVAVAAGPGRIGLEGANVLSARL